MAEDSILYWRGSGEVFSDLTRAIETRGIKVEVIRELEKLLDIAMRQKPKLLIVDASASEAEASKRIVELSDTPTLATVPVIFLTYKTARGVEVLRKQFKTFLAVDISLARQGLLAQLDALLTSLAVTVKKEEPAELPESAPAPKAAAATEATAATAEEVEAGFEPDKAPPVVETSAPPPAAAAEPAKRPIQAPAAIIMRQPERPEPATIEAPPKPLKDIDPAMLSTSYGGHVLTSAGDLAHLDDRVLIPNHPNREVLEKTLSRMTSADEWLGMHARRVAFIGGAITNSLALGTERDLNVRTSGLILNWGLMSGRPATTHADLFKFHEIDDINAIVDGLRVSAELINERLKDDTAARTISTIADLLGDNTVKESGDVLEDAKSVLAIEAIDRLCWMNGSFDSFGAYRSIRHLRNGAPFRVSEDVLHGLLRVLGEGVSQHVTVDSAFGSEPADRLEEEEKARAALREAKKLANEKAQFHVELPDLKPGMRLARPLLSRDGRVVLPANTEIDDDIIFRLWQLSAIRPLQSPVAVMASLAQSKRIA